MNITMNFDKNSDIIKWFWEILEEFNNEMRSSFIFYVTGKYLDLYN